MRDTDATLPRKPPLFITPPVAIAATLAILAFIVGFIFWDAGTRHRDALLAQRQRAVWSASLAAGQAERHLGYLAHALDALLVPGRLPASPAEAAGPPLDAALKALLAAEPMLDGAMLWDGRGALLAAAGATGDAGIAGADGTRLHAAAAAAGDAGFRVAGAALGGERHVLFAARWTAPREAPGARLLAVTIDPARVAGLFALPLPRADDLALLALPDGAMVGAAAGLGPMLPPAVRAAIGTADSGSLQGVAWPDGVARSTAFQRLSRLELFAVVGASEVAADEAYAQALARNPSARIVVVLLVTTVGAALVRRTRHQRRLLQRIALWEQAAEANPHAVLILDAREPGLPVSYANPAFATLTGLDRAESLGKPLALLTDPDAAPETAARLADALARGDVFHGEIGARRGGDGAGITLHLDLHPVHDAQGRLLNVICRIQDYTERQRAAEAERAAQMARDWALDELRKALDRIATSEGRFRDFAASASDWFWETDQAGRIVWLSDNAQALPGWRAGEVPPLPQLGALGSGAAPGDFRGERVAGQGPAGALVLEVSGRPVLAGDGGCVGFRGVVQDVTEQEQATANARRDELRLAAAVEHLPIGLLVVDADNRVLLCNARFCDLFEVDRPRRGEYAQMLTRQVIARLREQFDPATVEALIAERRRLAASGRGAMVVPWLDGRIYRLEERRHAGGDRTVAVVDVTELEESRARLFDAVQNITSGFAIFDSTGQLVLGNQPFHDHVQPLLPGMSIDGMTASALFAGLAAAGVLRLMQIDGRAALPEEIATRVELATGDPLLMTTADGRTLQVRLRQSGDGGRVVIFNDVSLLRQMDAALRSSEAKFRGLAQASSDAILIVDPAGEVQFANDEARRLFGYDDEDSAFDNIASLIPEDSRGRHDGMMSTFFAERRSRAMGADRPLRALRRDGVSFPVEVALSYYETPDGPLAQATIRDISQRLRAEEAERQRGKMVALGTLAGGIAHDLNNALVPILSLSELLLDSGAASPEDAEMLGTILAAAERARDLVRNILAFSRRGVRNVATLDLGAVVAKDMPMLRAVIPSSIQLDYQPPAGAVPVAADETNLHQVVVNLVSNAAQAIGGRVGTIRIAVAAVEQPEGAANGPPPGRYARLEIKDTGPGMDEETRQRLFEPFFTTKPVGEGTGLGLAIVHGIVGSHGGTIGVDSAPGRGTSFTIWLPLRLAEA